MSRIFAFLIVLALLLAGKAYADAAFQQLLQSTWPDAQKLGISRATFDAGIRGLEPDLTLPDLAIPGRAEKAAAAGRIRADAGAISARADLRAAGRAGQAVRHAIQERAGAHREANSACRAMSCWRSGRARPITAARCTATTRCACWRRKAFTGKRKDFFRNEFLHALKMLQDGVPRADLRSSWGGAMGLTQFLPSEYYKYAVDFDGDGKRRHLAFGAGCARLRRQAAQGQRLAHG